MTPAETLRIGVALIGCGYALEGALPEFWAAVGSQLFWGVGYTFTPDGRHGKGVKEVHSGSCHAPDL